MLIRAVLKIRREGGRGKKREGLWIYATLQYILSTFLVDGFSHLDYLLIMESLLNYPSNHRKIVPSITAIG